MSAIHELDLNTLLTTLSVQRPIFHSEADFQHELASLTRVKHPSLQVRLEVPQSNDTTLDVLLRDAEREESFVIELKYKTALWHGVVQGESFRLKTHGANDLGGYDVLKDVQRIEDLVKTGGTRGAVILVTNESLYWQPRRTERRTNAHEFRIHEGLELSGTRAWGPNTGGTMKKRESPIELANNYLTTWANYSEIGGPNGTFRLLIFETSRRDFETLQ